MEKSKSIFKSKGFLGAVYLALGLIIGPIFYYFSADHFHYSTLTKEKNYIRKLETLKVRLPMDIALSKTVHKIGTGIGTLIPDILFAPSFRIKDIQIEGEFFSFILSARTGSRPIKIAEYEIKPNQIDECRIKMQIPSLIVSNFKQYKKNTDKPFFSIPIEIKYPPGSTDSIFINFFKENYDQKPIWEIMAKESTVKNLFDPAKVAYKATTFFNPQNNLTISEGSLQSIVEILNLHSNNPISKTKKVGRAYYISIVTITTLGYGDIVPITGWGRTIIAFQSILGIFIIGFFLNATADSCRFA